MAVAPGIKGSEPSQDHRVTNAEWDSPMLRLAQEQFLRAARIIGLDSTCATVCCFLSARCWSCSDSPAAISQKSLA